MPASRGIARFEEAWFFMTLSGYTLLLSLGIFLAEMCVVTLGTMRIIFVARGRSLLAPILGFFEVTTWLFAITQVMQHLTSVECFLGFALGFSAGNYLGMLLERKLAIGKALVRIITRRDDDELIRQLQSANFGYTRVRGEGATGPVRIVMTVVKRRQLEELIRLIETCEPRPFYAIDDLQDASEGIFPAPKTEPAPGRFWPGPLAWLGKWEGQGAASLLMPGINDVVAGVQEEIENAGERNQKTRHCA